MTEENFKYRTSPMFLRNAFDSDEPWAMPVIPKPKLNLETECDLRVIGFDRVKNGEDSHYSRLVHFFLYDYKFENIWAHPQKYVNILKQYKAVLSPDFSMYIEMNPVMQLYNTFRNRWCGAFLAAQGIQVVPTVNWGLENTFDFCFNGIEKGGTVAVSTYMVNEHGHHRDQKDFFLKGYNEMMKRIEPELVICYNEPFPEMEGNILYINYDLSSWRHYGDDEVKAYGKDNTSNIIKKYRSGYVLPYDLTKGTGSVFGGEWQPKKPEDERFLGEPGEIKVTYNNKGEKYETKIGADGKAVKERHHTTHNREHTGHTNPHDHKFDWSKNFPDPGPPINYPDGDFPEFKNWTGANKMILFNDSEALKFENISEFKWCMKCHGEVEFVWKGKSYSIVHVGDKINIGEGYYTDSNGIHRNAESHEPCSDIEGLYAETADEILEYTIDGDKLRDIITEIKVEVRTI